MSFVRLLLIICIPLAPMAFGEEWSGWLGPHRDGVLRERGIVDRFPETGLPVSWRVPVGGGYGAPAVARGRVFVLDRVPASAAGAAAATNPGKTKIPGNERVICLSERTGRQLWTHEYDCPYDMAYPSGPRSMPQVDGDRVYTLGADGHLLCLDSTTGRKRWGHHFPSEYGVPTQTWGLSSSPLVDGPRLICLVGGRGQSVVAFDKRTGRELWRALDAKEPGYSSPILVRVGGKRLLIVWDTEAVSGLDPETGAVAWSIPFPTRMGHSIATPRYDAGRLFLTSFFDGSLMLDLGDGTAPPSTVWRIKGPSETRAESLHGLMSTPFLVGDHIYGVCGFGELRCLKAATGERVWETLAPTTRDGKRARWATAFLIRHNDRFFIWNELGELLLARLTPTGYEEISRQAVLEPTGSAGGRNVVWSMPGFANGHLLVRNDRELVRVDLRKRSR